MPAMTAHMERSISESVAAALACASAPVAAELAAARIIGANSWGPGGGSCGQRRLRHQFGVGPRSSPAKAAGIPIVALSVTFGDESFRAGVDLSTDEFWERMTAPERAVPQDRGVEPGRVQGGLRRGLRRRRRRDRRRSTSRTSCRGDEERRGRAGPCCPISEIHLVDSQGASMAEGILAFMGLEMAKLGRLGRGDRSRPQRPRRPTSGCTSRSRRSST